MQTLRALNIKLRMVHNFRGFLVLTGTRSGNGSNSRDTPPTGSPVCSACESPQLEFQICSVLPDKVRWLINYKWRYRPLITRYAEIYDASYGTDIILNY